MPTSSADRSPWRARGAPRRHQRHDRHGVSTVDDPTNGVYCWTFHSWPDRVKIGCFSASTAQERIRQSLGQAGGEAPRILGVWPIDGDARAAEGRVHRLLKSVGLWIEDAPSGEWFALAADVAAAFISDALGVESVVVGDVKARRRGERRGGPQRRYGNRDGLRFHVDGVAVADSWNHLSGMAAWVTGRDGGTKLPTAELRQLIVDVGYPDAERAPFIFTLPNGHVIEARTIGPPLSD